VQMTVTNIVGEKVKVISAVTNRQFDIRFSEGIPPGDAPAGIYFLSANTAHREYVVKVTVE
jgi:hypothetical protein